MSCPLISNLDVVRVTRVDQCGRPVCGEDNGFTFDCLASISLSPDTDEGDDLQYKAANGKVCGFRKGCTTLNSFGVEINFFSVSPEFLEITTGNPVVYGFDGQPIGYDDCSIACKTGFALEFWAEVLGEDVCQAEGTGGAWLYFLLPWVSNGILGDLEIGSEAVTLQMTGNTRTGGGWGVGPYDVMPIDAAGTAGPMLTPVGSNCHKRMFLTNVAPPEPTCAYTPVQGDLCLTS
ncbi:hypothetical protein [Streptomyces carpinensis]|uniref:hypothetical protein n=1 Tax=Streptomyces carpinensis TaxID=66369 RepID=UPI000A360F8E|nr:hypothetical protein [Streptomyces carpinensis]